MMKYIKWFDEISIHDTPLVGGKNSSLGEMITHLSSLNIKIPRGFAVTVEAYWKFIHENQLQEVIEHYLSSLSKGYSAQQVHEAANAVRKKIISASLPDECVQEIKEAYLQLSHHYNQQHCDVAVRSSATAEDLPTASFAGQQESFLNVQGVNELIEACLKCYESLFTDRAVAYRIEQGFLHHKIGLSIGVQKMVRSDLACAGIAFSLDTETGHKDIILIESSYGLGEAIVKGQVIPDEFMVHKPTLLKGFPSLIKKSCGTKEIKLIYQDNGAGIKKENVPLNEQQQFSLSDQEVFTLAHAIIAIEDHYSKQVGRWMPMDIEWAKDGNDGMIYIIQARPETVHAAHSPNEWIQYRLVSAPTQVVVKGMSVGQKIVAGKARLIETMQSANDFQTGDILVTDMTSPDWVPLMKKAGGIITNRGGRTCHAAIVSRELGIPAIVGTYEATEIIKESEEITLDCSEGSVGYVYKGILPFEEEKITLTNNVSLPIQLMVNIANDQTALRWASLPVSGVGLARIEFIIAHAIQVHPMALVHPERVTDKDILSKIAQLSRHYSNAQEFFVLTLARHISMIAAAFYPRKVIVRFSDFKSNEYRSLLGGSFFEPIEENPMIGLRGASRYSSELYRAAFELECKAVVHAKEKMGFSNISVMIPFVRTVQEAKHVHTLLERETIVRDKWDIIMMCEIPSNVICMDQFAPLFNGISIGSNDLTQLILGVDRDSSLLASAFNEQDLAVQSAMAYAIKTAKKYNISTGICGQAPSDYPEIARFLIECGIDSISLNPDAVIPFINRYCSLF